MFVLHGEAEEEEEEVSADNDAAVKVASASQVTLLQTEGESLLIM